MGSLAFSDPQDEMNSQDETNASGYFAAVEISVSVLNFELKFSFLSFTEVR